MSKKIHRNRKYGLDDPNYNAVAEGAKRYHKSDKGKATRSRIMKKYNKAKRELKKYLLKTLNVLLTECILLIDKDTLTEQQHNLLIKTIILFLHLRFATYKLYEFTRTFLTTTDYNPINEFNYLHIVTKDFTVNRMYRQRVLPIKERREDVSIVLDTYLKHHPVINSTSLIDLINTGQINNLHEIPLLVSYDLYPITTDEINNIVREFYKRHEKIAH